MTVDPCRLDLTNLATESDVEQKLVMPILTASEWLNFPPAAVRTKHYLPPTEIDKGAGRRIGYYPDYSIWLDALPLLIIEVKSPWENVENGFREAQLYAHELNKAFPTGINPVCFVLATNGISVTYGPWDARPSANVPVADLAIGSARHKELLETLGFSALKRRADMTRALFRPINVFRPIDAVGGDPLLNRRLGFNSFAAELAPLIRMYFVSESAERIDEIVSKAYISTDQLTSYDQILETYLRERIERLKLPAAKSIETTRRNETC